MFFHEDLNFYTNKKFRSYEFLSKVWDAIEHDIIYSLGLIQTGNMTLVIDPGIMYLTFTSNYTQLFSKTYQTNFNHSLDFCDDFTIEIDLQIVDSYSFFFIKNKYCKLYFQPDKNFDEGIVEYSSITNLNIENIFSFKKDLFLNLVKEIQYAINRNIFYIDIQRSDSIKAELDSDYEVLKTYQDLNNLTFDEAVTKIKKENLIFKQNIVLLVQLEEMISKMNNLV